MAIHVGDIGTTITVTVLEDETALDISGATTKEFIIKRPDGDLVTKTASFVTTGTDGRLRYTVTSGDVSGDVLNDISGTWQVQVYLEMPGWSGKSESGKFTVVPVLVAG